MKRSPKVPGHRFIVTERFEPYDHRSVSRYTVRCRVRRVAGNLARPAFGRGRSEHNKHLKGLPK